MTSFWHHDDVIGVTYAMLESSFFN